MNFFSRMVPPQLKRSTFAQQFLSNLEEAQEVASGPFKGIHYGGEAVCSASIPKVMGVYEIELSPCLLDWSSIPFRHIIDVGAAEGYYVAGCAKLWPQANVTAFESTEEGQRLLKHMIMLNGLQARVEVMGHCEREDLHAALVSSIPTLIIMDVEGAEGHLLNPTEIPFLVDTHIIVEIHDCFDDKVGDVVRSQLESSHFIREVWSRPRSFRDFSEPRGLWRRLWFLPYLKQYANENRPGPMRWFCCIPKSFEVGLKS